MKLYMPTVVYSDPGCVIKHSAELAALGTKAMIVTGRKSSRINGSLTDVEQALKKEGIEYVIFDEIEENPSVETVANAARIAKDLKVDFFVGVGGGSPMDAGKAISFLAKNPEQINRAQEFLYTKSDAEAFPVACVPTTCGTGSEVTQYSILTLHDAHTKKSIAHRLFPALALVDAGYLKTASYAGMVSTAVDALAHLLESYLNTNANDFSRIYAEAGLRIWGSVKWNLVSEEAFRNMTGTAFNRFMEASVFAGMAIAHTGTSLPHGLSYAVTYELHVPHGKACGLFLPGFLKNYMAQDEVQHVLSLLAFADVEEFSAYMSGLLGPVIIPEDLWSKNVRELLANPAKMGNYPFSMTEEVLRGFYHS